MNALNQIEKNFSNRASQYSLRAKLQHVVANKLSHLVLPYANSSSNALDIGSGTGFLSNLMPKLKITNIDISHSMCQITSAHNPSICANMHQLPFRAGSFNMAISSLAFQWSRNLPQLFSEISKMLSPSSMFIFSIVADQTLSNFQRYLKSQNIPNPINPFPTSAELQKALSQDFQILNIFEKDEPNGLKTPYQILKSMSGIGANASFQTPLNFSQLKTLITNNSKIEDSWHIIYFVCRKK